MATEVKQRHIFATVLPTTNQVTKEIYLSASRQQPKMMVNSDLTKDLVQLLGVQHPQQQTTTIAQKQFFCSNNNSKKKMKNPTKAPPLSRLVVGGGALKSKVDQTTLKQKVTEVSKSTVTTRKDERGGIDSTSSSTASRTTNSKQSPVAKLASVSKPPRVRIQSTGGETMRRTIFDSFWKRGDSTVADGDSDSQSASSSSQQQNNRRKRSNSVSKPRSSPLSSSQRKGLHSNPGSFESSFSSSSQNSKTNGRSKNNSINIMRFSPPVKYRSNLRSRFGELHQLPNAIQQLLPPLPSPLSRICHRDGSLSSGGMYPLTLPRSILHTSSYEPPLSVKQRQQHHLEQQENLPSSSFQAGDFGRISTGLAASKFVMSIPLSLTDSMRLDNTRKYAADAEDGETSDDTASSIRSATSRRVQFDPRVTISEYDDCVHRQWYSDSDLTAFKFETIAIAQRYLLHHPDVAAEFSVGKVDPFTGSIRKNTLYSLPILNNISVSEDDDDDDAEDGSPSSNSKAANARDAATSFDYSERASIHVQKILIVDPNTLILDLFRKSLLQIFPHSELTTVQTGDEAVHHMKRAWSQSTPTAPRAYDIVIMEERLRALPSRGFGPSSQQSPKFLPTTKSCSLTDVTDCKKTLRTTMSSSATMRACSGDFQPVYLSGSEVIARLKELENDFCRPDRCILEDGEFDEASEAPLSAAKIDLAGAPVLGSLCWRSLIVGVCVDQKHDAVRLWQSGCDVVWPKPPPPIGENVRNQLVSLLVKKRSSALTSTGHYR